jgi:MbtH protein
MNMDNHMYKVMVNSEEQYALWPAHLDNPLGWRETEKNGSKEECLAFVKETWMDMTPLSIRKA